MSFHKMVMILDSHDYPSVTFLWGYFNSRVYVNKLRTIDALKIPFVTKLKDMLRTVHSFHEGSKFESGKKDVSLKTLFSEPN